MTLKEALKLNTSIFRSKWDYTIQLLDDGSFLNLRDNKPHYMSMIDIAANDWVPIEQKTDKILAAELVINLLKTLTEEINKSNNKIMEAVEAKDIVVTNSLISIQSELFEINKQLKTLTSQQWVVPPGLPVYPYYGSPPVVTFTSDGTQFPPGSVQMQVGDPVQPIATVTDVSWYKRGESNGKE